MISSQYVVIVFTAIVTRRVETFCFKTEKLETQSRHIFYLKVNSNVRNRFPTLMHSPNVELLR